MVEYIKSKEETIIMWEKLLEIKWIGEFFYDNKKLTLKKA